MSMKENVNYIKEELSTQESFLENFLKLEKFYGKYKKIIFSSVAALALGFISVSVLDYISYQNKIAANEAFNTTLENPNDTAALEVLKSKNQKLYEIALYMKDGTKTVNVEFLKELSAYTAAVEKGDPLQIGSVTQKQGLVLKDFAIFNKALIEAQKGKYQDAKETLRLIPETSNIASLVTMLEHFLMTK